MPHCGMGTTPLMLLRGKVLGSGCGAAAGVQVHTGRRNLQQAVSSTVLCKAAEDTTTTRQGLCLSWSP